MTSEITIVALTSEILNAINASTAPSAITTTARQLTAPSRVSHGGTTGAPPEGVADIASGSITVIVRRPAWPERG